MFVCVLVMLSTVFCFHPQFHLHFDTDTFRLPPNIHTSNTITSKFILSSHSANAIVDAQFLGNFSENKVLHTHKRESDVIHRAFTSHGKWENGKIGFEEKVSTCKMMLQWWYAWIMNSVGIWWSSSLYVRLSHSCLLRLSTVMYQLSKAKISTFTQYGNSCIFGHLRVCILNCHNVFGWAATSSHFTMSYSKESHFASNVALDKWKAN